MNLLSTIGSSYGSATKLRQLPENKSQNSKLALPETVTVALAEATALAVACATAWARELASAEALPPPHTFDTALETAEAEADAASL